ncbi:glycosyltransferase family 2 protein [Pontibacter oryzae]|uniref:Glycosyltransferase family 2 protein n=1 Tax=Pontibacter oryzae TaxID=2304593 RepID=A0A399SCL0_9BACT|nr:glycosyltransferase family 2 protein [Pontibacter oryzae]RIJ41460.1 glycosyltransferase family 2 protein [Pontibacter oryzae]
MANTPLITVVIATYNGARFLEAQLNSVYGQSYKNIEVIVCDDRSDDATHEVLQHYASVHGLKYYINQEKLGVVQNFAKGMKLASGMYLALCDQDDVWLPEKLQLSLAKMNDLEANAPAGTPALVYTDLQVVNEDLNCICPSYWQYMQLNPNYKQLNRVLVENVVTGCTALINRPLLDQAQPMPPEALMHDVWLTLVATCFGQTGYVNKPLVLYRQHGRNVVGAARENRAQKLVKLYRKMRQGKLRLLNDEIAQADSFYKKYLNQLSLEDRKILEAFISLKSRNFIYRKWLIFKYSFFGSTWTKVANVLLRA